MVVDLCVSFVREEDARNRDPRVNGFCLCISIPANQKSTLAFQYTVFVSGR